MITVRRPRMLRTKRLLSILLLTLNVLGLAGLVGKPAMALERQSAMIYVNHPIVYHSINPFTGGNPPFVPSDVRRAYDFLPLYARGIYGNGTRIAIVDAFGDPTLASDL